LEPDNINDNNEKGHKNYHKNNNQKMPDGDKLMWKAVGEVGQKLTIPAKFVAGIVNKKAAKGLNVVSTAVAAMWNNYTKFKWGNIDSDRSAINDKFKPVTIDKNWNLETRTLSSSTGTSSERSKELIGATSGTLIYIFSLGVTTGAGPVVNFLVKTPVKAALNGGIEAGLEKAN
jgi:hypothetical protein